MRAFCCLREARSRAHRHSKAVFEQVGAGGGGGAGHDLKNKIWLAYAGVQFSENWCGAVTGVGALSVGDVQFGCRARVVKSSSEAIVAPR